MHGQFRWCGLGVVIVIQTPCLPEGFEISPWPKGFGWTVIIISLLCLNYYKKPTELPCMDNTPWYGAQIP